MAVAHNSMQTLNIRQWWVTLAVLVALPILIGVDLMNDVVAWYTAHFVEPGIERSLGFKGGILTLHRGVESYQWYGVVSVVPGGAFERSGIRAGDLPVWYQHGARIGLISHLRNARGHSVTLHFMKRQAWEQGSYESRAVTVSVP